MSFKSVQNKIAKKGGYSKKAAGAILASASRNASASAKRKNPKLNKVKGRSKRYLTLKEQRAIMLKMLNLKMSA